MGICGNRVQGYGVQDIWATKFILFCVTLNLSDNLTETPIMKNSNEVHRY